MAWATAGQAGEGGVGAARASWRSVSSWASRSSARSRLICAVVATVRSWRAPSRCYESGVVVGFGVVVTLAEESGPIAAGATALAALVSCGSDEADLAGAAVVVALVVAFLTVGAFFTVGAF